jgi:hypothetical protein
MALYSKRLLKAVVDTLLLAWFDNSCSIDGVGRARAVGE